MLKPLFSVIIPTYNNADVLPLAVQCIIDQKCEDWELIVIDDGSEDETENYLEEYLRMDKVHYFFQNNQGVTIARNEGVKRAQGDFITFLDSDDKVETNWLEDFKRLIEKTEKAGYVSCGYLRNGKIKLPKYNKKICPEKYSSLAGTFAIKRKVFLEIGGYDIALKQSENWEMTARALQYCVSRDLAITHTDNVSFEYENFPTPDQTRLRDEYRGDATYHLYNKYKEGGVLHYKKNEFLFSSAVNYTRAGKFKKSRRIFYQNFKTQPSFSNFVKVITFEIPFLRRRKWMRK